jgi:hypothetical protein
MKKLIGISIAASVMALATPAMAQDVTGTVNITGTVAPKCLVVPGAATTFGTTVALGELSQADGRLRTDLATIFASAGGAGLEARVVCTTPAPTISVDATAISTTAPADAGYDNSIDFTANVEVTTVTGTASFSNNSSVAALAATPIGGRLANNGQNNIKITASDFATGTVNDLLVAATDYTGQIVVVVSPGA